MKKLRFLIAIVLIFSLLPVFGVSATEQTDEIKATETYEFKKLEAFGLMSESDPLFYYDTIKRSLFISYIMKCYPGYGVSAPIPGIENPFSDVNSATEAVNEISAAAYTGLISGVKGSEFRPNDSITKSEAAKIFVTMLGYQEYAERKGGYPSGYLAMAESLNLFGGCEFTSEGYLTVKSFLKAYGNVLDTEVLEVRSVTLNAKGEIVTQSYKALEGQTLLYNTFGIYEAKGIVESNEYTSLYLKSDLNPGEVEINGYLYKADGTGASSLLGYNTHYYYKKAKGAVLGEIVYIEPYNNTIVSTHTNNIIKDAVTETNFRYYKDEASDKFYDLTIAQSATMIYNGDIKGVTKDALCPQNGTVTLIDYNDDKVFDVVYVMNYRTIIISSVSPVTHQIMDAYGGASIEIDPKAEDYDVVLEVKQPVSKNKKYDISYELYGEYLPPVKNEFSELKAGDIVLYAASTNNNRNIKYVKVSRDVVEGKISSMYKDYFVIDGNKYELSPDAKYTVSVGEEGTFYLDFNGKVVTKSLENKVVYGYLNGINKDSSAFESFVQIQVFSENGRWLVLNLADNVKTNITGDPAVFDTLKPMGVYNALNAMPNFRQLINYTVNKEGKVNNITIAKSVEAYSGAEQDAIEQDTFRSVYSAEDWGNSASDCKITNSIGVLYDVGKGLGYLDIQIDNNTRIFTICEDNEAWTRIEPNSKLITAGPFIPYNINDRRIAEAVVIFKKAKDFKTGTTTELMHVLEVIKTTNSSGELVSGVTGICDGVELTVVAAGQKVSAAIDLINKGDIIQFVLDANGEIYDNPPYKSTTDLTIDIDTDSKGGAIKRRYNATDSSKNKPLVTTSEDSTYGATCTIYFVDAKANRIMVTGKDDKKRFVKVSSSTKYYIYDAEKVELTPATLADLSKGTFCFMKRTTDSASLIYIIK